MDYPLQLGLPRQLAIIDEHIMQTERNIAHQRQRVATIEGANRNASVSLDLLETFQQCLVLHHRHRERILHELNAATRRYHPRKTMREYRELG
jgi:uncharacterized protein (UPF0218 family)